MQKISFIFKEIIKHVLPYCKYIRLGRLTPVAGSLSYFGYPRYHLTNSTLRVWPSESWYPESSLEISVSTHNLVAYLEAFIANLPWYEAYPFSAILRQNILVRIGEDSGKEGWVYSTIFRSLYPLRPYA